MGRRHARPVALEISSIFSPLFYVPFYTRRLPHWQPLDADFFVTWRLYGSLPKCKRELHGSTSAGAAFVALDKELDSATNGPLWLKRADVADRVSRVLLSGMTEWQFYELHAWVIMANHIHVLLRPNMPLCKALMNVKSASARAGNAALGRAGQPFWQSESYDHWVRSDQERNSIIQYIHRNPVRAGLVTSPEDWPWSSLGMAAHGAAPQVTLTTIRAITPADAASAAQLSAELGYPVAKETMEQRITALEGRNDHAVFLACVDETAAGWIDVGVVHHLQSEPYGEIGGFVVSEQYRSSGIGKQLIARAEAWMRERGLRRALVRSQIVREKAHRFYLREGYARVKTSAVFEKELSGE